MAWLLDTNICSYALKNKPLSVARRLSSKPFTEVKVSTITAYELFTGCQKSPARDRLLKEVNAFLAPFTKLEFSAEDAFASGQVRSALEASGTPIGPYDVLLAGQALARNLILVTTNTREFRRIKGLQLEDWSE